MIRDHIVEEIHQIRQQMLDECDGDLDKLMDRLRDREIPDSERIVTLEMFREKHPSKRDAPSETTNTP